ncbi:EamA family transporter [Pantanalinema sp. GBBB05]|uniref:EamA family transporter n=1 Tax=Pantanalinema sp. GBBB05 TaxID=2604139 RepID=UPI001D2B28AE|nr:EamA family transporter [Pantanalinema sp. GBBB05]
MGQMDHQPGNRQGDNRTVEQILQAVTQDLRGLHQGLVTQLSQEVTRLQGERSRLLADIEKLQTYHQGLQTRQIEALSQQQLAQQQLWAKQLAVALANHLQALMVQQIRQMPANQPPMTGGGNLNAPMSANGYSDNANRLLASLDSTFNATFKTLQQELNSYHSSLSQQLNRMHSMEQQGEAILEALVTRLREQLQLEASRSAPTLQPTATHPTIAQENGHTTSVMEGEASAPPRHHANYPPTAKPTPLSIPGSPLPLPKKKETSNFQLGLILVLLSTVALSIHNVVVQIIGNGKFDPVTKAFLGLKPARVLGTFDIGGYLALNTVGNSLLILWLRMLVVLPLMIPVAMFLYPPLWRDIKKFLTSRDRRPMINVVGSGFFLFLSQILIYIAIGDIGPGPAVTILFMYPILTVPLAWALFGDRPTPLRWIVMFVISFGVVLTALPKIDPNKLTSATGILIAVGSGVFFALYLIFMQLGFKKLHPVPVSLVQFATIFLFSSVTLLAFGPALGVTVLPENRPGILLGGLVLGVLTLIGYLANNFGVRFMGAARASIIASSGPVMTALLAFWIIRSPLAPVQISGIVLVTLGVSALSFERMVTPAQAPKPIPADARR